MANVCDDCGGPAHGDGEVCPARIERVELVGAEVEGRVLTLTLNVYMRRMITATLRFGFGPKPTLH